MGHKLFPYQKEGVLQIEEWDGRALLADDPGLGKTLQALKFLQRNPWAMPALVVCPAIAKHIWEAQAMSQVGLIPHVCHGRTPPPRGLMSSGLYIINYDILPYWQRWFDRHVEFNTLIADECHSIQHATSKKTKAVMEIGRRCRCVLGLSGTPMLNEPSNIYNILSLINPLYFRSFFEFATEYCKVRRMYGKFKYSGARNIPKLHTVLKTHGHMIRRLKKDVLKQLPPRTREIVPLPMRDATEYKRASTDFFGWLKEKSKRRAVSASRAEGMVKVGYLKQLAARLKFCYAVEWVDNLLENSNEKIVIFAYHTKCIEALARHYHGRCVVVSGATPANRRKLAEETFQNDARYDVFIGQIGAAGVALTLTAATTTITLELVWRPADHDQADDRIYRIGQTQPTWAYYLVAHGTVEDKICKLLQDKQAIARGALDGGAVPDDFNIYDRLVEMLLKEKHGKQRMGAV
jgi:SWI/SNF-related matrix-associated actin-dependent regulator 1 of chromatin subfamily A